MTAAAMTQWLALGLCAIFALLRLPGAIKGQNRGMAAALLLATLGICLSLDVFYRPIDGLLGGVNVANLILRFSLYIFFIILGTKGAVAFKAPRTARLISGPTGWVVLGGIAAFTVACFLSADMPESSTGLWAYGGQPAVEAYGLAGRIYPAYIAACLLIPVFAAALDRRQGKCLRVGLLVLGVGLVTVVVYAVTKMLNLPMGYWDLVIPFCAIILVAGGLLVVWLTNLTAHRQPKYGLLAKTYGGRG